MKSIAFTYPGFRDLPRGIKQMLVTSENVFFENVRTRRPNLPVSVGGVIRPLISSGHVFRRAVTALPRPA